MLKGKVLKMRSGRDANCSSEAYIGSQLVGFGAYLGFMIILFITIIGLKLKSRKTRVIVWVVAQLIALTAWLIFGYTSGAMDYGSSVICVFPGAIIIFLIMLSGLPMISGKSRPAEAGSGNSPPTEPQKG